MVRHRLLCGDFFICDFFVDFRKDSYILAILVGYLLRGLMTTLLQRIVNGCQMAFFDAYQVRASFFKSASTLDTLTVANCLPQLAAR